MQSSTWMFSFLLVAVTLLRILRMDKTSISINATIHDYQCFIMYWLADINLISSESWLKTISVIQKTFIHDDDLFYIHPKHINREIKLALPHFSVSFIHLPRRGRGERSSQHIDQCYTAMENISILTYRAKCALTVNMKLGFQRCGQRRAIARTLAFSFVLFKRARAYTGS